MDSRKLLQNETFADTRRRRSESTKVDKDAQTKQSNLPTTTRLIEWSDLAPWQKWDNEHIQTGYRMASGSYTTSIQSWTYLHNESVNIYTHLLGSIMFCLLPLAIPPEIGPLHAGAADLVVMSIYAFGVATCFLLSASYHTLICHSEAVFNYGYQLDYQGIIVLMWGATVPLTFYTFLREPLWQVFYWTLTTFFAAAASVLTFTPQFSDSNFHRTCIFSALALSTLLCVAHGIALHGWSEQNRRFAMSSLGLTLLCNAIGATAYALRYPERVWRRTFDIFGSSHQVMHVMIVFAAVIYWYGCFRALEYAQRTAVAHITV